MEKTVLKPELVFHYFNEICQVPRPSKKEEKIRAYLIAFAQKHNLPFKEDEAGNILIEKPASAGKGGFKVGSPRFPSIEWISAVSSPHTNAPAP